MMVKSPWSEDQVANLWRWQINDHVHSFTCANRGDGKHQERDGDLGTLMPTPDGWICLDCDYRQDWAHDFMLNGEALRIQVDGPDTIP